MAMLNMIGGGAGSVTAGLLSQVPETWNPALYQLAVNVHGVAVKPLTSVVLAVMLTLELARSSTRLEAFNNRIKTAIRMTYGFHHVANLIALVMLRCGGLDIRLPQPAI